MTHTLVERVVPKPRHAGVVMKWKHLGYAALSLSLALPAASCLPPPPRQLDAVEICHEASQAWDFLGGVPYTLTLTVAPMAGNESLTEYGRCSLVTDDDFVVAGVDEDGHFHRFSVDIKADAAVPDFPVFENGDLVTLMGSGEGDGAAIHLTSDDHKLIVQARGPNRRNLGNLGLDVQPGSAGGGSWFSECRTIQEVSAIFSERGEVLELTPGNQGSLNEMTVANFSSARYESSECFDSLPTGFIVSWAAWE